MTDKPRIASHENPAARERTNHIVRLDLAADDMPGCYEQMWTRTEDQQRFELCCIPFFPYGLSLGDIVSIADEQGTYRVEAKGGHRTIRFSVEDKEFAHRRHEELHGALAATGVLMEFSGHAYAYGAVDIVTQQQADAVVAVLVPLAQDGTLVWEWADPEIAER